MGELIAGSNFSGRSEALRARLRREDGTAFFLGPYAEAALSGLSSTVEDEIAIYARPTNRVTFMPDAWLPLRPRKPATLSGGEQVLLALHCFSRSAYRAIGIDTALEQLDGSNRTAALSYLDGCADVTLIDNRIDHLDGWTRRVGTNPASDHASDLAAILPELR